MSTHFKANSKVHKPGENLCLLIGSLQDHKPKMFTKYTGIPMYEDFVECTGE